MKANLPKSLPSIGFLTVCPRAEEGLFGGYLVLNAAGRPLEFHCTAPVRATRAQEILYGPTLKPFLYGEHIGRSLLAQSSLDPAVVCTDTAPALAVRPHADRPVVLVLPAPEPKGPDRGSAADAPRLADPTAPPSSRFALGPHQLVPCAGYETDRDLVLQRCLPLAHQLDLLEPFQRIRQAIDEARRQAA